MGVIIDLLLAGFYFSTENLEFGEMQAPKAVEF